MLLIIEWVAVLNVREGVEELRMVLAGVIPVVLEGLKTILIRHPWPSRLAKNMLYGLIVEVVKFAIVVVALWSITSGIDREKSLYALLFCGNFFMAYVVNIIAYWDKNK